MPRAGASCRTCIKPTPTSNILRWAAPYFQRALSRRFLELIRRSIAPARPARPTPRRSCATQAPLRERMRAMYGMDGQVPDKLTEFSKPASGSFYFAPSVEALDASLK